MPQLLRASTQLLRSRPWQIGSSTARLLLLSASGSPPIPITLPAPPALARIASAARAFALARSICLPPAPVNTASCFGIHCASPSGGPLGAQALGSLPRLVPANGRIGDLIGDLGQRPCESGSGVVPAAGREGSAGLSVLGCIGARFLFRKDSLEAARAPRPAPLPLTLPGSTGVS